jgi:formamidopyrimidine-DNA glycosylase
MPELPEVETIKRQLQKEIAGKKITGVLVLAEKTLKMPKARFLKNVVGTKIKSVERRAKLLIWNLNNGWSILTHLKMTGQYILSTTRDTNSMTRLAVSLRGGVKRATCLPAGRRGNLLAISQSRVILNKAKQSEESSVVNPHTRVIFSFGQKLKVLFNDMRRFGYLKLIKTSDLPKFLDKEYGPEPLDKKFTVKKFEEVLKRRPNMKIKQLVMEQKLIAGIGNIYAQEACFMARVLPMRQAKSLKSAEIKYLYLAIRKVMNDAIKYGGTSSENYLNLYGKQGDFVKRLKVYGRGKEKCRRCGHILKTIKLGGRGTVYCGECQK